MRRVTPVILAFVFAFVLSPRSQAQEDGTPDIAGPVLPGDVLEAAAAHYPEVLSALAARRGAVAGLLENRGAFDTVFSVRGRSRALGYYDGQVVETKLSRPLRPFGAEVFGAYRLSEGDFPIYEDIEFTDELGEVKLGVLFSLLRDRVIDDRRFGERDAALAVDEAEAELLLTRIGVQQQALIAYWRWVAAGRQLEVYEDLLALALSREEGLERQVARGARARIFLTENAQNVTRRRILVAEATRDFRQRGNALGLYLRDPSGQPVPVTRQNLPPRDALGVAIDEAVALARVAMAEQPLLRRLATAIERARGRIALANNELKPRLDFAVEVGEDIGATAEGGRTRDDAELIVGLKFEVPLGRRAAKGRLAKAEADLTALQQRRRLAEDRLRAELADISIGLETAQRLVTLARQEVDQADTMRRAEERRFESGASDFFLVNQREEALADAQIRRLQSELTLRSAQATFDAATLDLDALGLGVGG